MRVKGGIIHPGSIKGSEKAGTGSYGGNRILIIDKNTGKSSKAEVVGNKLYLIGADGKKSLAKDGIYKTTDGKTLSVVKGAIITPGDTRGLVGPSDTRGVVGPLD